MEFSQETINLIFNKLDYDSLPQHILASMVKDLSKQNQDLKEQLKAVPDKVTQEQYKAMEKEVKLADNDFIDIKNKLEEIIRSKDNQINELKTIVAQKEEEIDILIKMTKKKKKKGSPNGASESAEDLFKK